MKDNIVKELIRCALKQLDYSYAPYSKFKVGAALLTKEGKIFTGCNIENAAYSPSNCAERTAIFKAVSEGYKELAAICIVGGMEGNVTDFCYPCGVCRQVMKEFCSDEFDVIVAKNEKEYKVYTLAEIYPFGFGGESIK